MYCFQLWKNVNNTNQASGEEEIKLILQETYIKDYLNESDRIEYLKEQLSQKGAEKLWEFESYQKEYWKYNDIIIIIYPNRYEVKNRTNSLINNEGNTNEKGYLIDISQGGIPRKDIKSLKISKEIPENYSITYDVSESRDGAIMLYGVQTEDSKYDVSIVSKNTIYAPEYSARLFSDLSNLESIDLNGLDTSNVTNMYIMFSGCNLLENLDLSSFNTQNVTIMTNMFSNCNNLKNINLENFDTSNVVIMQGMFRECSQLVELNLNNFKTSNVTNMSGMFGNCKNLSRLDLSSFNTSKVINMSSMFFDCNNLQELNLSTFNTENVVYMASMFINCTNLLELDLSMFNTKNLSNCMNMFQGCKNLKVIYVGSNWNTSNAETNAMFYGCGVNDVTPKQ